MKEMQNIWPKDPEFPKGNPFDVPEGYFDMLEDRIAARIKEEEQNRLPRQGHKIIKIVKPLLWMAASFALAFLLIKYPISKILPRYMDGQEIKTAGEMLIEEEMLANPNFIDERTFFQALISSEAPDNVNSDEVISYISSEINDYDIYAEIIK